MAQRLVYMNGKFVNEKDAKISIYDSALMFGDMLFEMTRSFNQLQFKLREHLERLYIGIKILQIPMKMSIEEMEQICLQTAEKNIPFFDKNDDADFLKNYIDFLESYEFAKIKYFLRRIANGKK